VSAVDEGQFRTFLLHGVTGSGKTEVYMAALERALRAGRGGIVLVPEIALTPQTVRRFRSRFGDRIAVLHSRLSDGERYDAWRAIRRGDLDVVIGPRSAVFAPVANLGLVVVDEEHESSYKQFDPAPRYHARDVAVVRASLEGAVCVLGSATPSLESLYNARSGKYELLSMPGRITPAGQEPARLPDVRIVDLAAERRSGRGGVSISAPLQAAIRRRLDDGHQVILLQNRRGFAPVLECADCGWSPACPDCAVTLTYHKAKRQLRCHYCGRAFRHDGRCGQCGGDALENLGAGTQRVEEDLAGLFPEARVLRMDLDTTSARDAHDRILSRFGRGEADILLGTQMVAKGLDFERVTLVGVIDADAGLLLPDLRSDERIFQLLTQVAGRAGRASLRGEVLLQTRNPDHPVIRLAKRHDYDGFAASVLPARHALGYPPFTRLVRVDFRGPDERAVAAYADRWKQAFDPGPHAVECIGPAPAFVPRVRKTWRMHVLLKAPRSVPPAALRGLVRGATERAGRPPARTRTAIDVDPMDLL
jgi:primosomal protein N' (replication factor Y)